MTKAGKAIHFLALCHNWQSINCNLTFNCVSHSEGRMLWITPDDKLCVVYFFEFCIIEL